MAGGDESLHFSGGDALGSDFDSEDGPVLLEYVDVAWVVT
jgi:hypothetical protein